MSGNPQPKPFELQGRANSLRAQKFKAVTPSNSTDLPDGVCIGIVVGVAGTVVIDDAMGVTQDAVFLAAGIIHPIEARRIRTASTATSIVAVY